MALGADVVFESNGVRTPGIQHAQDTTAVVVANPGAYEVTFSISAIEPSQFAVYVNGAPVNGALYGSGAGTQQNFGQTILMLSAGDVLTVRNDGSFSAATLQTLAGGNGSNVLASMLVKKLGEAGPL